MAHARARSAPPPARQAREPSAHDRILAAALAEFARHGFAGARVDRIGRKARLNKAMLYYHFGSKARLYRAAIQGMLVTLVERLEHIASGGGTPADKLDRFIDTFVSLGLGEPSMAPIILREVTEGGSHLDRETLVLLTRVAGAMTTIVREGQQEGVFRPVDPLLTYLTTAWPIVIYLASGPIRETISRQTGLDVGGLDPHHFIGHMQAMSRQALAVTVDTLTPSPAAHRHTEHAS